MFLLYILPKKLLSYLFGCLVRIKNPKFLQPYVLRWYVNFFKINQDEFEKPLLDYPNLAEFFVRNLKAGVRPIQIGIVSPVDAQLRSAEYLNSPLVKVSIKDSQYDLGELIGKQAAEFNFSAYYWANLYLAPKDYHHIHSPISAKLVRFWHIPGNLWPVNDWALSKISKLFAVNERVVLHLENDEVDLILVLVGAYNVGSISLVFNNFRSNLFSTKVGIDQLMSPALEVSKGQRLATFHMGSSVAMFVFPKKNSQFSIKSSAGQQVKMGETLGLF